MYLEDTKGCQHYCSLNKHCAGLYDLSRLVLTRNILYQSTCHGIKLY